jgi:uncharacterized protein YggE
MLLLTLYPLTISICMNEETRSMILTASRPVRYAAAAALSVLALFLLVKTFDEMSLFGKGNNPPVNTITVTGTGEGTAIPDIAHISFTVQESAATVVDAQAAATKRTNDALAAMKVAGIEDKDTQTSGYSINPQYASQGCAPGVMCVQTGSPKITGYQVMQTVDLTIRDTAKAGDVLQKLGTLGVQNVSGPDFTVSDDGAVSALARGKAIEDAKSKAQVLAGQLGVKLGDVVSFSENGNVYPMYASAKAVGIMSAAAPAPSLPVGQDQRKVTVQVTYQIR